MKWTKAIVWICVISLLFLPAGIYADDDMEELEEKVSELELKVSKMKLFFGGDFRVRYDYTKWGINEYVQPFFDGENMDFMQMPGQTWTIPQSYSWRLRLKFGADITDNLHFFGRLNAYRLFGGADVPIFNGTPESVHNSFNSTRIPTDNIVRVERAYFTWEPRRTPIILTLGRQASTDGPPRQVKLDTVRQGTPIAILIDAEIDGLMLGFKLDDWGLPDGSRWRICYGIGFEGGFGSGGNTNSYYVINPMGVGRVGGLDDAKVLGTCLDIPYDVRFTEMNFCFGYFRLMDLTDIPYGMTRNFPDPFDNNPQNVTATENLGDMDLVGFSFTHDVDWLTYFVSMGYNRSHPNGNVSQYGFGGLLGNPDESESGYAVFLGASVPLRVIPAQLGLEYNHGSKNWWSYTPAADDISNKLGARGNVVELYFNYHFDKNILLRTGYVNYTYDYAFSGWQIAPAPLDFFNLDNNPVMPYPFPKNVDNFYMEVMVYF